MSIFDFDTVAGTTISFDTNTDSFTFAFGYHAGNLVLTEEGANLRIAIGGSSVLLTLVSISD